MNNDASRKLYRVLVNEKIALPLDKAFKYIEEIDFELLVKKITQPSRSNIRLWTPDAANDAIVFYKNYLKILRAHGNKFNHLPPSFEIDEIWHHHILDTEKYEIDCRLIFGHTLHHYPYFGMRSADDFSQMNNSFEDTQRLHMKMFGVAIPSFEEIDPNSPSE